MNVKKRLIPSTTSWPPNSEMAPPVRSMPVPAIRNQPVTATDRSEPSPAIPASSVDCPLLSPGSMLSTRKRISAAMPSMSTGVSAVHSGNGVADWSAIIYAPPPSSSMGAMASWIIL